MLSCFGLGLSAVTVMSAAADRFYHIGAARIDITPAYPIRLSGYAVRKTESTEVAQRLWAKAMAIGTDKEGPALLITVDNIGVPRHVRDEVVLRLQTKQRIDPARVAICSTHSHTTPCLAGNLETLFGEPLPPEHLARVERYTRELVDAIERVALEALRKRKPGKLNWGQSKAGFAANRRTQGGPVDHDLPVLTVTDRHGRLRALFTSYACHCTTLGGDFNQVCGDWAGYAQEILERDHPGAVVLVGIGCGADANPHPRTGLNLALQHGQEIAAKINALLTQQLTPLNRPLVCRTKPLGLPFDPLPSRAGWEQRAQEQSFSGYHARWTLAKLARGESLPTHLPYLVQTWNFGDELAVVFLPGEVVVDYSLRLKREFDSARLWVNAYANDVPCYIPSERILKEGGYEGGGAMIFYGLPARLAMATESLIVGAVHDLLPQSFRNQKTKPEETPLHGN
jgi:hypothetical protein